MYSDQRTRVNGARRKSFWGDSFVLLQGVEVADLDRHESLP
jgi:hypothetical protein